MLLPRCLRTVATAYPLNLRNSNSPKPPPRPLFLVLYSANLIAFWIYTIDSLATVWGLLIHSPESGAIPATDPSEIGGPPGVLGCSFPRGCGQLLVVHRGSGPIPPCIGNHFPLFLMRQGFRVTVFLLLSTEKCHIDLNFNFFNDFLVFFLNGCPMKVFELFSYRWLFYPQWVSIDYRSPRINLFLKTGDFFWLARIESFFCFLTKQKYLKPIKSISKWGNQLGINDYYIYFRAKISSKICHIWSLYYLSFFILFFILKSYLKCICFCPQMMLCLRFINYIPSMIKASSIVSRVASSEIEASHIDNVLSCCIICLLIHLRAQNSYPNP